MTHHHDRMRSVLLVHGLKADHCAIVGEDGDTDRLVARTARVVRVQARLAGLQAPPAGDGRPVADTGSDAEAWLLAMYDAALVELCAALGVRHALLDDWACPDSERQRVELELLSSVLPIG
jgi:hypothetical protein